MHHPGPPQFMAVGERIELAPRDPDPEGTYRWRVRSSPVASQVELGEEAVAFFAPDAPGTYTLELDAPDDTHELTVRAFPGDFRPEGAPEGVSGYSGASGRSGMTGASGRSGMTGGSGSGSGVRRQRAAAEGGRPRVQLRGRTEGDTVIIEADPQPNPNDDAPREDLAVEFLVDDRSDVDDADVEIDGWELRVPVAAVAGSLRVHAVAVTDTYSVADAVEVRRTGDTATFVADGGPESDASGDSSGGERTDGGAEVAVPDDAAGELEVDRLYDPPGWATDVTLYEIYVRGFASDNETAETTFAALEQRLDYLADLGVDCLWLTPVLQNDHAPHGYNIIDFFSIAEDLGDREDYESFVDAAHERGMKVLFDLVLNHSARAHPFFQDAYGNPDSEYYDWYEWQASGEPGTYFDWEYIANFDYRNLEVRRHLLDAVDEWFEVADGFRCDMAWAVPKSFWQEIRDRVKSRDPEFLLLDETIPYIADFHEGMFDVHFDTTLYFRLRQVGGGDEPADALLDAVEQRTEVGFPDHAAFMLYQENHDETRYIVECSDEAALASAGALFTLPGVPMLYAGQELGQQGRRDALAWDHAREEIREHYARLVDVHDETEAFGPGGDFRRVDYDSESEQVTAFARETDAESYVVALNFGEASATFTLPADVDVDSRNVVDGRDAAVEDGLRVESVTVLPLRD